MRLKGRVALVTGASRGIGRAIALAMAREGAEVGINYVGDEQGRNLKDAREVEAAIRGLGRATLLLEADVASETAVDAMVGELLKRCGKIDILVNNAGILRDKTLKNMTRQEWDAVLSVNLTGVFNCTHAVINPMREAQYGRIINMASISGQTGNLGQCHYAASKAGVMAFTKSIAREGGRRGITANAIAPGLVETEMFFQIPEENRARFLDQIPVGRFATVDDIAELAVFLASDAAAYITGQVIHINGGLYM